MESLHPFLPLFKFTHYNTHIFSLLLQSQTHLLHIQFSGFRQMVYKDPVYVSVTIRPPCCTGATIHISLNTCLLRNNSEVFSVILTDQTQVKTPVLALNCCDGALITCLSGSLESTASLMTPCGHQVETSEHIQQPYLL